MRTKFKHKQGSKTLNSSLGRFTKYSPPMNFRRFFANTDNPSGARVSLGYDKLGRVVNAIVIASNKKLRGRLYNTLYQHGFEGVKLA